MENKYKEFLSYVLIFLVTFGVAFSIIGMSFIPSASMEPTLSVGKKYPYCKVSYLFSAPERGDIIIYDREGVVYCKRLIGLPGDHIKIADGYVYVNGEKQTEAYAHGVTKAYYQDVYDVPEGEYFVLGDNRENSKDSRMWDYPFIQKKQILGHVLHKEKG